MSQIGLDFPTMASFVEVPLRTLLEKHPGLASSKAAPIHGWTYTMKRGANPQRSSFRHLMRQLRRR